MSDASIVTALSLGANDVSATNFSIAGASGNITTAGDLAVNGSDITTTSTGTATVFNTSATTLNIGGASTTYTLGATTATGNIRGTTINFPNATAINAGSALLTIDSASIGGGYGSTGVSISNTGNIQANGTLTIDGASVLTGNVTAGADLAVNGGDITTDDTTFNLINTTATTLNIGGAATTISLGNSSGTTTVNNGLYVSGDLTAVSNVTFTPSSTNDITFNTDSDSILTITGLPTATGNLVCIDNSTSQITKCASDAISLQSAYDGGNTITTTNARDIAFTLADTATDSNFTVTSADGSTGYAAFLRADGTGTSDPSQLVLIDNQDTDRVLPTGLRVSSTGGGGVTTAIDLSDASIVTALSLGANDVSATNFSIAGASGNITTAGDLAVNGSDITTTSTGTATVFNTSATTLNIGGASTTYTLGATTATGNIRGTTINFPNATAINAGSALLTIDSASIGGGYGSTGVSISNTGNIQANGTLTIDGASVLTGNVTAGADLAVNGGDITTDDTTFNLINTTATTLNIGGAATTISLGNSSGTTTVNNGLYVSGDLTAVSNVTFTPSSTNDITFNTDSDSILTITGLPTATGNLVCIDNSTSQITKCASDAISLQSAYDGGNTITTTNARDIAFTLADTATDSNFTVTSADGSTGYAAFLRADGTGTSDPSQLVLIDNQDTDRVLPTGLRVSSTGGGGVTTAIDLSDASIVTALSLGANDVSATNFSIAGASGNITTAGDLAVNGSDITTTSTGTATVFNTSATTLNIGGASTTYTLGATTATGNIRGTTINFPNATAINAGSALLTIDSASIGGGYGSTGVSISNTGNIQANGTLTIDGASVLTGNVTAGADLAVNGGDITTDDTTFNLINTTATTLNIGGAATTISLGNSSGTTTVNNGLTVTGNIIGNANLTVNGQTTLQPSSTNDITFVTDSDSILTITGLPTATGNLVCIDNSTSQITKCASDAISLQSAYDGGNTITTTNARDIAFTLADTATDSNFTVTSADGSTGYAAFLRADGTGTSDPSQLVLIDNQDTDRVLPTGLRVSSTGGGGVTTAIDLSDASIVTALSLGANDVSATNFSIDGATGNITTAGDLAVNGGDITTTSTTANLFNTTATTLNIGGASTTLTLGATTGTATIRNAAVNIPNGSVAIGTTSPTSALNVTRPLSLGATGKALVVFDQIENQDIFSASASGVTRFTIANNGNLTTVGDIAVNGGDITTTSTTANLFNTTATTLNIGGAATTLSLGAGSGTTTVNNDLTVTGLITANGGATVSTGQTFTANGISTFSPDSTNDVTINTDADSFLVLNGLTTPGSAGSPICLDATNNVTICGGGTFSLQTAYDGGNTITTTNARDIAFTLADTATDSNFTVTSADGSTGYAAFLRADGTGTSDPSQLVLIDNQDTDRVLPTGLRVSSTGGGGVTTAIDLSDASIVTALSLGANDVSATNFSIAGASGNITTAGDLAVNGSDITTTSTGTATVFNTSATTLNIGGASTTYTLGATTATGNIRGTTINFPNATAINAGSALLTIDSASIGGGYGSTGVSISNTGNIQANGTLTIDGASVLTGNVTAGADLAVNGGDITTDDTTFNLINTTATTLNIGGAATTISLGNSSGTTTVNNDLAVSGTLTSTGLITADGGATISSGQDLTLASYTTNGTLLYTNGSGVVSQISAQGALNNCLLSQGAGNAPAFGSCASAVEGFIYWDQQNGAVFTKNDTVDLLLGSNATDSAKFAVIGINNPRGQQTASVSGNLVLDAQGSLQTTNNQTLTIGGDTTGNVIIDSNTSLISLLDNTSITGTLDTTGNITTAGDLAVNGGDITTNQTTANLFNTTATTLNIGGAATTLSLGNSTGTTTINSTTLSLPNATAINAGSALLTIDSLQVGGGYGSTGVSISNTGNIQANGTLTIDGASVFGGTINANSGTIDTNQTTANLFNTTATTLNIGGAATTLSLGNSSGTTTVNNNLAVSGTLTSTGLITADGGLTVSPSQNFIASGSSLFSPDVTNDVTFITDADSTIVISGLQTTNGTALCLDGSDNLVYCTGAPFGLQAAYNTGNTITTTNARDIAFTLADTASDSNFTVTTEAGGAGYSYFALADGTNTSPPSQLVLVENLDTNEALPSGIKIQSEAGGITTAIDLSDAEIVTALSLGANDVSATNFSIDGATGNITTAGDLAVNGGDITTTSTTANLFNTTATTLNIGGAATTLSLGNSTGTTTINSTTLSLPNATAINAGSALLTIDSLQVGGGYGSTGVSISNTGNIQANGTLTIDGASVLTGNVTAGADLAVNGGDITTTSTTANLFNTTATTLNIGGAATTISLGAGSGTTTVNNDLAVSGTLTSTGLITADGGLTVSPSQNFIASGSSLFSPDVTNDVTFITDADSTIVISGLQTTNGTALCLDGSDNLVYCTGAPFGLQAAYNTGNTITTTNARDIAFTLADTATDSNFTVTSADGSTGYAAFLRADGTGTSDPLQLVLLDNQDTDRVLPTGLKVSSTGGGGVTTAIDLSDASIVTALSLGANDVSATNFSIDGATGNITTAGDLAVNGGDITTSQTTFNLLDTTATTLNIGGASTTLNLGAGSGTTTVNNNLAVSGTLTSTGLITANGGATVSTGQTFTANGISTFSPDSTNDVTINTDADSFLSITGLTTVNGSTLCLDASNNVVLCSTDSITLQSAYDGGNTITTTNARDIAFTLADTASDSNFTVTTEAGGAGYSYFALADGTNTSPPSQLVLVENLDTNEALPSGIKIQSEAGGITTAIDLSDAEIVTALSLGANDVSATNFSIDGATGNITTAGDLAVNGGDITTSQASCNSV